MHTPEGCLIIDWPTEIYPVPWHPATSPIPLHHTMGHSEKFPGLNVQRWKSGLVI